MARKVIIDCDPGIDDAVALCMAMFDPRLEVIAVTATSGTVSANQSSRNVQAITERLDPPRWPRFGVTQDNDALSSAHAIHIHGDNGLGNIPVATSELHNQHASDKVIVDTVHNAPGDVSIIALGPLTNIAAALKQSSSTTKLGKSTKTAEQPSDVSWSRCPKSTMRKSNQKKQGNLLGLRANTSPSASRRRSFNSKRR